MKNNHKLSKEQNAQIKEIFMTLVLDFLNQAYQVQSDDKYFRVVPPIIWNGWYSVDDFSICNFEFRYGNVTNDLEFSEFYEKAKSLLERMKLEFYKLKEKYNG